MPAVPRLPPPPASALPALCRTPWPRWSRVASHNHSPSATAKLAELTVPPASEAPAAAATAAVLAFAAVATSAAAAAGPRALPRQGISARAQAGAPWICQAVAGPGTALCGASCVHHRALEGGAERSEGSKPRGGLITPCSAGRDTSSGIHEADEARRPTGTGADNDNAAEQQPLCDSATAEPQRGEQGAAASLGHTGGAAEEDERFMRLALDQARLASAEGEVPVGAVIVTSSGRVVAAARNRSERANDPTAHAEVLCLRDAARALGHWRNLKEATLYVTLEPCPMCAGAILQARVRRVVWGARNNLLGADGTWISLLSTGVPREKAGTSYPAAEEDGAGPNSLDSRQDDASFGRDLQHNFHRSLAITRFVLERECSQVMQEFFRARRLRKTNMPPGRPLSFGIQMLLDAATRFFHRWR